MTAEVKINGKPGMVNISGAYQLVKENEGKVKNMKNKLFQSTLNILIET